MRHPGEMLTRGSRTVAIGCVVFFAVALGGCASTMRKFQTSQTVNFGPFADNTLALLSTLDYKLTPDDAFLLRGYIDRDDPSLKRLLELQQSEKIFLQALMNYSLHMVELQQSSIPETAQVRRYAEYLEAAGATFIDTVKVDVLMTPDEFQSVRADVRAQKTLLAALRAARPLAQEFAMMQLRLMGEMSRSREAVVAQVFTRIDSAFGPTLRFAAQLDESQRAVLAESRGWNVLDRSSAAERQAVADRLRELQEVRSMVSPDLSRYSEARLRMARMSMEHDEKMRRLGAAVLLWSRAHVKMSDGTTNPAEWFDPTDVKGILGVARGFVP